MSDGAVPGGRGAGGFPGGPSLGERRLVEETRERFLREIVARVPLDRLEAVHLFRPMRQGGFESGVAVIAAEMPTPEMPTPEVPTPEVPLATVPDAEAAAPEPTVAEPAPVPTVDDEATDVASGADTIAEPACDPTDAAAGPSEPPEATADEAATPQAEADTDAEAGPEVDAEAEEVTEPAEPAPDARPVRHTVFTARYRLAIKGPDRGKWEVEVVEEADAPMVTVEAVVRGVLRRAGDEADPERLDAASVARLVGAADPRAAAPP